MEKSLTVKTDIHCQACVDKLTPHLNGEDKIKNWQVDIESNDKLLTVIGEDFNKDDIAKLLSKEGYSVKEDDNDGISWTSRRNWKKASFNTLNCLIGCSIGDFGMIIYLQAFHPGTSMITQMILAIIAGLMTSISLETVILKFREKFNWKLAFQTAVGMSFISMVGMEIAMNITDFAITGGKADFEDPMYWTALIIAMIAGFIAPLPYNYYRLEKYQMSCH